MLFHCFECENVLLLFLGYANESAATTSKSQAYYCNNIPLVPNAVQIFIVFSLWFSYLVIVVVLHCFQLLWCKQWTSQGKWKQKTKEKTKHSNNKNKKIWWQCCSLYALTSLPANKEEEKRYFFPLYVQIDSGTTMMTTMTQEKRRKKTTEKKVIQNQMLQILFFGCNFTMTRTRVLLTYCECIQHTNTKHKTFWHSILNIFSVQSAECRIPSNLPKTMINSDVWTMMINFVQ